MQRALPVVPDVAARPMALPGALRAFDQAPGFVAMLEGPEHRFTFANAAYRALVGGRNVVGKTAREALPELEGQGFFELLALGPETATG